MQGLNELKSLVNFLNDLSQKDKSDLLSISSFIFWEF